MARPPVPERNWVNIQWLTRLRWAEIAGQASTVLVGQVLLAGALPMAPLLLVIGIGLISNLALELYFFGDKRRANWDATGQPPRDVHEWQLALVMMLDIVLLTALLYLTGGPDNPFGFLYVVQIALAAVLVRAQWTWMLVGLSFVSYGMLLATHQPLAIPGDSRAIGMWVALGVASAFVVYFLLRITASLAQREAELTETRGLAARQERLASLATMAAGAAHELSTPLGTVALAAKELEHALAKGATPDLASDARLIREQVGRCRTILEQMAQGAGTVGESVAACTVAELLEETMTGIRDQPIIHRELADEVARAPLRLPPRAVSQALRSLVTNAQDASPPGTAVVVAVRLAGTALEIVIRDRGPGIASDVLERVGEPFFTTKAPGRGMGLGLFLSRAVIEGVGGSLRIDSRAGEGTEVAVSIPCDVSPRGPAPPIDSSRRFASLRAPAEPELSAKKRESATVVVVSKPA